MVTKVPALNGTVSKIYCFICTFVFKILSHGKPAYFDKLCLKYLNAFMHTIAKVYRKVHTYNQYKKRHTQIHMIVCSYVNKNFGAVLLQVIFLRKKQKQIFGSKEKLVFVQMRASTTKCFLHSPVNLVAPLPPGKARRLFTHI